MKLLKVAAAVLNQTPFDWQGNEARIRAVLTGARHEGVTVLCLPELVISGYGCEDAFHMPHLQELGWQILLSLLPETRGMIVALGLPVTHRGALFNVVAVAVDGKLLAMVPKKLLAGDGVHYEPRWFKSWPHDVIETFERDGMRIPIGDVYIDASGVRIGFEICEEAWVANRPGANLARKGVDIILNPSASHFAFGKRQVRERFVSEGSRAFNVAYIYSNLLGNESGRIIFDGGALIASEGHLIARGDRFSWRDSLLTSAMIDIDLNRMNKTRSGSFQPLLGEEDNSCVEVLFRWPDESPIQNNPLKLPKWETSADGRPEEFARAVALGLFDFLRKAKLHGFTISLSGGVDSAVVTILSSLAIRFAFLEIGMAGVKERLGYIPGIHKCHNEKDLIAALICTAYQATANSSDATRHAARDVAEAVGTRHFTWNVEAVLQEYRKLVGEALGVAWDWKKHDTTLQNIQARTRSPSIWMLANLENHLLLATSNRSEAAVGYATMDGDTSGGLAPISGIDKAYLRQWTKWMESTGPEGIGPIPALTAINRIPPTAELRPPEFAQTDEKDLMPYDVLDVIERAAIRDKRSPLEVFDTVKAIFPEHSAESHRIWVKRFFTLWCRNQWKRERYAPGFHLDDESLDPKTWCRFPILSGGFVEELAALDARRI